MVSSDRQKWFDSVKLTWFEKFMTNLIKCGQVPRHVAIIMDGNRRYSKKVQLNPMNTYNLGFEKIKNILKYSHHLGINEITIFAFSIENFKRDQAETDLLMSLAIEKFSLLLEERDELMKNDVCIRFIGDLKRLPIKLQKLISELMLLTCDNSSKILNVCMAYTSSYEFEVVGNRLYNALANNVLNKNDELSVKDLETCLLTYRSQTDPELLIRTSGEIRLSDFLLWQSNYSTLAFVDILWPEATFFEFCKSILKYQLNKLMNHNIRIDQVIKSNRSVDSNRRIRPCLKQYVDNELQKQLTQSQ